ncbi:MAG: hypothetical protein CO189_04185 [candidate division Zixibacteria bacterium CG_4_9_14_3_um_filter_46_8]|nr:MAG: hypothetical protein CO189_04185 [candidate division Zixibacteria bacterium CG_4_9_14_3_um_filter_46_8]
MKIRFNLIPILLALFGLSRIGFAENIDRILAIVDSEIILNSEFTAQYQMMATQGAFKGLTQDETEKAKGDLLDQMINDKLILIIARGDTSIVVTSQEINEALEDHIKNVRSRFPSEESFINQLATEGLTVKDLRNRYKDEVKKQLLKDRLLKRQLNATNVNNQEVKDFFEIYGDSLPKRPASIKLAHILTYIKPGESTLQAKFALAESLHTRLLNGDDFAQLAKNYSDDPTGAKGGDLGYFGRGDMVPPFEREAFSLMPGQVSGVVKTDYGYHIIKCTDRDGERIRCSHILLATSPTSEDTVLAQAKAVSVYKVILNGAPFEQVAKEHSEDAESRIFGGELGWYAVDELTPEFKEAIGESEAGIIIAPTLSPSGFHILKVLDRQPERPVNLDLDWHELKELARRQKASDKLQEMIAKAHERYNVEVRKIS